MFKLSQIHDVIRGVFDSVASTYGKEQVSKSTKETKNNMN